MLSDMINNYEYAAAAAAAIIIIIIIRTQWVGER